MKDANAEPSISRRNVLKRSAGALAVGGGGLAAADGALARQDGDAEGQGDDAGAQEGDTEGDESAAEDSDLREGVTCGDGHPEDSTFTVGRRCDEGCSVINLTGLSPACLTETKQLYVDLPETEPTVWMNPRKGEIPPGTYRVERAERCEEGASECDGDDLYRLEFRPTDD
jgi:hypothetical protein